MVTPLAVLETGGSHDRAKTLVNLTGHPLAVASMGRRREIPVEGQARVESRMTTEYRAHTTGGIIVPVLSVSEARLVGLPPPMNGRLYIVSGIVASFVRDHHPERDDVVSPGRVKRSRNGRVVGCEALVRLTDGRTNA